MVPISIVAYHNSLIVIRNMEEFAHYYCYTTKQKMGPENK